MIGGVIGGEINGQIGGEMARRTVIVAVGAFVAGICLRPTVAAALQEIRLEAGSSAVVSAGVETRVSCAGTANTIKRPECTIAPSVNEYVIRSDGTLVGRAPTLLEAASVVEKMSAAGLCR